MFAQRENDLKRVRCVSGVIPALLLLLTTSGQPAKSTTPPAPSDSPTTTQQYNISALQPLALQSHRPCGEEHQFYCGNGGQCMYPQDNNKPFCICTSSYSGLRCMMDKQILGHVRHQLEVEEVIGIIFGVAVVLLFLAFLVICIIRRRCEKSASLEKSKLSGVLDPAPPQQQHQFHGYQYSVV